MATAAYQAADSLRTGEQSPAHTASDLRETATHLAAAHAIAADLLGRMAPHLPLAPHWNPHEAISRLRATGAAWVRLRRAWAQTVSIPDSGPRSPLTVQAASVAIRLGRLAYDDPTWTPQAGPGRPRAVGELLDPQLLDALCITISTLAREGATIAANQARLCTDGTLDLYSTNRAHRPDGESRRFFRLRPSQHAELADGYRQATRTSEATATALLPMSHGYEALKATALAPANRRVARMTLELARQQQHQGRPNQRLDSGRPVTPKN